MLLGLTERRSEHRPRKGCKGVEAAEGPGWGVPGLALWIESNTGISYDGGLGSRGHVTPHGPCSSPPPLPGVPNV